MSIGQAIATGDSRPSAWHATIPVVHARCCGLSDAEHERLGITRLRSIAVDRTCNAQRGARLAQACTEAAHEIINEDSFASMGMTIAARDLHRFYCPLCYSNHYHLVVRKLVEEAAAKPVAKRTPS